MLNDGDLPIKKGFSSLYQRSSEEKDVLDENQEDQDNQSIHSMQEIYP